MIILNKNIKHQRSPDKILSKKKINEINFFMNKFYAKEHFSFIRYTHGFWDKLFDCIKESKKIDINSDSGIIAEIMSEYVCKNYKWGPTKEVLYKNIDFLRKYENTNYKNIFLGTSFEGCAGSTEGRLAKSREKRHLSREAHFLNRKTVDVYDGLLWKNMAINGSLPLLFDCLKNINTVFICPSFAIETGNRFHVKHIDKLLGLKKFHHIEIHPFKAYSQADNVLNDIYSLDKTFGEEDRCYIFIAGSLANYLILKMHNNTKNTWLLNMGKTLECLLPYHDKGHYSNWLKRLPYIRPMYEEIYKTKNFKAYS